MSREPLYPPFGDVPTSSLEYRITYRNNDTGQQFTLLSPDHLWREKFGGLTRARFDVLVQKRRVTTTSWETVAEHYVDDDGEAAA
ncbi:hypothetical protein [Nocardia wallacei]|uniref:hypothetical protein n=1 Tax=Nocardia wallacei TaxID=480035 RepID=UPI00245485A4|nr:hypothetical protein [Nocardia wallacei]